MVLKRFIKKYHLELDSIYMKLCFEGTKRMKNNRDPHHALPHIHNLLSDLDLLIQREEKIRIGDIDFEVLLPAICWHDTWKGSHIQTRKLTVLVFREVWDSRGSRNLLKKYIKKNSLQIPKANHIYYSIVKHNRWSKILPRKVENIIVPIKNSEAKILSDIDALDEWGLERLRVVKDNYVNNKEKIDPKLIPIGKWWFEHVMWNANDSHYFFDYSKKEFARRKKIIMEEVYKIWNDLDKLVDAKDPKIVKHLKLNYNKVPQGKAIKDYYKMYRDNNENKLVIKKITHHL